MELVLIILLWRLEINGNNENFSKFENNLIVHLQTGYWQGKGRGLTFFEHLLVSGLAFYICYLV